MLFAQLLSEAAVKLQKCGQFDFPDTEIVAVAYDSANIYIATGDGSLHSIDAATLRKNWSSAIGGAIVSNLIVAEGRIHVAVNAKPIGDAKAESSVVRTLNAETGLVIRNSPVPYSDRMYVGITGKSLVVVSQNGSIVSTERVNGNVIWVTSVVGKINGMPDFDFDRIVVATDQKEIISIDGTTGKVVMRSKTRFRPISVLSYNDRTVAIGDERGNLALIDSASGKTVWKYKSGGKISNIAETSEGVLALSNDNFVYMLWDYNGDVLWKRRLPGRIASAPLIGGDTISVQVSGERSAFILDVKSGKIINQLQLSDLNSPGIPPSVFDNGRFIFSTLASLNSYSVKPCAVE